MGRLVPELFLLPHLAQMVFHLWGQPEMALLTSSHISQCQHHYILKNPLPLGALGLSTFDYARIYQVSNVFPSDVSFPLVLSKFLAKHVRGQFRL